VTPETRTISDSLGQWHATRPGGGSEDFNGEISAQLPAVPPKTPAT
jgi:hypothetical protein